MAPVTRRIKSTKERESRWEIFAQMKKNLKEKEEAFEEDKKEVAQMQKDMIVKARAEGLKEIQTSVGVLNLVERENWDCSNTEDIAEEIGEDRFIIIAKVSKSDLEKEVGEVGVQSMLKDGVLKKKESTFYFLLKG